MAFNDDTLHNRMKLKYLWKQLPGKCRNMIQMYISYSVRKAY